MTSCAIRSRTSSVSGPELRVPRQFGRGTPPMEADSHSGNSLSPCSPTMYACTFCTATPVCCAMR